MKLSEISSIQDLESFCIELENDVKFVAELNETQYVATDISVRMQSVINKMLSNDIQKDLATKMLSELDSISARQELLESAVMSNFQSSKISDSVLETIVKTLNAEITIDDTKHSIELKNEVENDIKESIERLYFDVEKSISRHYRQTDEYALSTIELKKYTMSNNRLAVYCNSLIDTQKSVQLKTQFLRDLLCDEDLYYKEFDFENNVDVKRKDKFNIEHSIKILEYHNLLDTRVSSMLNLEKKSYRVESIVNCRNCYQLLSFIEQNINEASYELQKKNRRHFDDCDIDVQLEFNLKHKDNKDLKVLFAEKVYFDIAKDQDVSTDSELISKILERVE